MAGFQNTLIATFVITLFSGYPTLGQNQRAVLYDQYNGDGNYIVIPESYVANLADERFDDKTHSVCVTGTWLFYQNTDFNTQGVSGMEYVFGRDNYCVNLRTLGGRVSSIRYAGAPKDYRSDSLTLFQFDYFQGQEEYTPNQLPNLNLVGNHKSIIITGNSDWTVYDRPSYSGNMVCLKVPEPGNHTPSFISDLQNVDPSIPHGSIRSVRKGCSERHYNGTVTLTSFARMETEFKPTQLV